MRLRSRQEARKGQIRRTEMPGRRQPSPWPVGAPTESRLRTISERVALRQIPIRNSVSAEWENRTLNHADRDSAHLFEAFFLETLPFSVGRTDLAAPDIAPEPRRSGSHLAEDLAGPGAIRLNG